MAKQLESGPKNWKVAKKVETGLETGSVFGNWNSVFGNWNFPNLESGQKIGKWQKNWETEDARFWNFPDLFLESEVFGFGK